MAAESTAVVRRAQLAERRGQAIPPGARHQSSSDVPLSALSVSRFHDRTWIVRTQPSRQRRWPWIVLVMASAVAASIVVLVGWRMAPSLEAPLPVAAPAVRVEPLVDDGADMAPVTVDDQGGVAPAAQVSGFGVLQIGSKPPCDIYVDDRDTGLTTPQRAIRLRPGRHRIGLTNADVGIDERFTIDIRDGRTTKVIRDMSDRL